MEPGDLSALADLDRAIVHASCVAVNGRAVLITGRSGSGKSALALSLLALGGGLVCDDRVALSAGADGVIATAAPAIAGLIEARGIGLIGVGYAGPASVGLVVDMERTERSRLPPAREIRLLGHTMPLLRRIDGPHFAAAIYVVLKSGRVFQDWPNR